MLDLQKEVVKIKFDGEIYEVSKPNNGQIREYNKKVKGKKGEELDLMFTDFLEEIGLPSKLYNSLTPSQAKTVIEALYGTEKN